MSYDKIIEQFLYSSMPAGMVNKSSRFESIMAELIGSKQRRNGPQPSPEIQVALRSIVRDKNTATMFIPWGARKQNAGDTLDILEFMAIKQLLCLQDALLKYDFKLQYMFRIEDLTDQYLFRHEEGNWEQINQYCTSLYTIIGTHLRWAVPQFESGLMQRDQFEDEANPLALALQKYLEGEGDIPIGFEPIPSEQYEYFKRVYERLMPESNPIYEMSKYFAAVMTRRKLRGSGRPEYPHLFATFSNPIPGDPVQANRLYYRTLPERYTHSHRAPWLSRGYLSIDDETNEVQPQYDSGDRELIANHTKWGTYEIAAHYRIE